MKHLYSIISIFLILISVSLQGRDRVYAPSLSLPENNEVELAPNVTLDWNAVTGETLVVLYELQLADNADFTDATTFAKSETTSLEMTDLLFGQSYYWRVKAYDGAEISDWSEAWNFTVAVSIEMIDPSDGASVYADPNMTWEEMTGLLKYQIQIDTSYVWNNVVLETSSDILGSFIIDETNMWLVGTDGIVLHFDGSMWMTVEVGTSEDLNSIYFVDATTGFIAGENGTFLMYDGTTWTTVDAGVTTNLTGVAFADATNGYMTGEDGLILKYADGSFTTEIAYDGTEAITSDFYDVAVVDANNYWVCGKSKIIVNYNGTDWTGGVIGSKDHFALWFNDANDGWASSKSGRIQHFNGSEWMEFETGAKDLYDISFDGTTGYAVGKSGAMVVYDGSWSQITSGTTENLNTVYLKNSYGIAGGDEGTLVNKAGEGFNSPYARIINVISDSSNYDMTNLLFGKSFYYRMRGIHSLDTSAWSGAKSMISYPYPEPETPNSGASNQHLEIELDWSKYSGVTIYNMEISMTEDFQVPLIYSSDSNSAFVKNLEFGQEYFWRVNAEHPGDISAWSEVSNFTTINDITLLSPADNTTGVLKCPHYSWEEIIGASGFQIFIDTDENFSNPFTDVSDAAFYQCVTPLIEKTTYYWKVRGISGLDSSNWSPTWSFETEGPEAINDLFTDKNVEVYPNPSTGNFTLDINSLEDASYNISISDISGSIIYNSEINCKHGLNKVNLNLTDLLSKGVYFISINHEDMVANKRLIIK